MSPGLPLRASVTDPVSAGVERVVAGHFDRSAEAVERFFAANDELVAQACLQMAKRFARGGRLFVLGEGAQRSDAEHVAVEFVHPVIVGKRALPALALGTRGPLDAAAVESLRAAVEALGRPGDMLLTLSGSKPSARARAAVEAGTAVGMLVIELQGAPIGAAGTAFEGRFALCVEDPDPMVVQEVSETVYHVLWELVHVFLDRGGLS